MTTRHFRIIWKRPVCRRCASDDQALPFVDFPDICILRSRTPRQTQANHGDCSDGGSAGALSLELGGEDLADVVDVGGADLDDGAEFLREELREKRVGLGR